MESSKFEDFNNRLQQCIFNNPSTIPPFVRGLPWLIQDAPTLHYPSNTHFLTVFDKDYYTPNTRINLRFRHYHFTVVPIDITYNTSS